MTERRAIETIRPNDYNPNRIPESKFKSLVKNFKRFGYVQPILIDQDGTIIDGYHRWMAAKECGYKELECVIFKKKEDIKEYRKILTLAMNNLRGENDEGLLIEIIEEVNRSLQIDDIADLTGFEEKYLEKLLKQGKYADKEEIEDQVPDIDECTAIKPGDIIQIGKHILLCGDSTDEKQVSKLMGDQKADAVFTDPPYGVSYKGTNNPNGKPWTIITGDKLRGDKLYQMLAGAFEQIAKRTKDQAAVYICYASRNHTIFETAIQQAGMQARQQLIWVKHLVLGHSDYHWSHEPILYCTKEKRAKWYGDRTGTTIILNSNKRDLMKMKKEKLVEAMIQIKEQSTALKIKKDNWSEYLHPTQKPVQLSQRAIENSTPLAGLIYEPFAGSGSTIIAAEKTGRECRAMEIDPHYCAVIIERFCIYAETNNIKINGKKVKWNEYKDSKF